MATNTFVPQLLSRVTDGRVPHVYYEPKASLQRDRLSAGVLRANLLLSLALGFLLGCQVNMSDFGQRNLRRGLESTQYETAVAKWGAQIVVHCPPVKKHSQCTLQEVCGYSWDNS